MNTRLVRAPTAIPGRAPEAIIDGEAAVWVVAEDEPRQWRVADRANDVVLGPFPDEAAATRVAFEGARFNKRWIIHIVDLNGTETANFNSDEDAMHVRVD
ncbi:MAG: hypothetical protein ABIX37_06760 [Gammaproteobacteria bacterium]